MKVADGVYYQGDSILPIIKSGTELVRRPKDGTFLQGILKRREQSRWKNRAIRVPKISGCFFDAVPMSGNIQTNPQIPGTNPKNQSRPRPSQHDVPETLIGKLGIF